MIRWFLSRWIGRFERAWGYDASYLRDILDADARSLMAFGKVTSIFMTSRRRRSSSSPCCTSGTRLRFTRSKRNEDNDSIRGSQSFRSNS